MCKQVQKVQFSFFKEAMDVKTEKAQLIKLGNVKNPIKVWIPFSQITIEEDTEREGYYLVTIPEWLFFKTRLPEFTDAYRI